MSNDAIQLPEVPKQETAPEEWGAVPPEWPFDTGIWYFSFSREFMTRAKYAPETLYRWGECLFGYIHYRKIPVYDMTNSEDRAIRTFMDAAIPVINSAKERHIARSENGKKGGAPTGNQNARKKNADALAEAADADPPFPLPGIDVFKKHLQDIFPDVPENEMILSVYKTIFKKGGWRRAGTPQCWEEAVDGYFNSGEG